MNLCYLAEVVVEAEDRQVDRQAAVVIDRRREAVFRAVAEIDEAQAVATEAVEVRRSRNAATSSIRCA